MSEEQYTNPQRTEVTDEERLRDIRARMGEMFVNKTEPGKGIAIIGGRQAPQRTNEGKS